ncbi:hypothetical protein ACTXT7_015176 [Hymenolepis weldensis]
MAKANESSLEWTRHGSGGGGGFCRKCNRLLQNVWTNTAGSCTLSPLLSSLFKCPYYNGMTPKRKLGKQRRHSGKIITICMQTESVKQRSVIGGSTGNHRSSFTNSSGSSKSLSLGANLQGTEWPTTLVEFGQYRGWENSSSSPEGFNVVTSKPKMSAFLKRLGIIIKIMKDDRDFYNPMVIMVGLVNSQLTAGFCMWRLLASMVPYSLVRFILKTCTLSLTYACYAFDFYARQNSDVNVEALLLHISNYWSVFMGYGLPLGFLVTLTSNWYFTGDLLVSFLYPILVIGAFQISWSKALDPKHRVSPCLRDLAVMSMKPALFITNTLISIITSIGLSFIFP